MTVQLIFIRLIILLAKYGLSSKKLQIRKFLLAFTYSASSESLSQPKLSQLLTVLLTNPKKTLTTYFTLFTFYTLK